MVKPALNNLPRRRSRHTDQELAEELGALEYPGFAYLSEGLTRNPAVVLLDALDRPKLDVRVVEGLPWLPYRYPSMNWEWVVREACKAKAQNKVGFIVDLAMRMALKMERTDTAALLRPVLSDLGDVRRDEETTLCQEDWPPRLRSHTMAGRTPEAAYWHLVTRLKLEDLSHYA